MNQPAIETRGLVRSFGPVRALDGLDLSLPGGQAIALVGPNGAGKTTLLLILAALLGRDGGSVIVGGFDPSASPKDVHRTVGWMPDFFGVYEGLTVREYLELFASFYGLPRDRGAARASELLDMVGLADLALQPVHTLSRGQKQRLGFARVLVHEPRVLLLDEPASGLDPRARIDLRYLVRSQRDTGVTVIVSSHILAELEEMCDSVLFMDEGRSRGHFGIGELPDTRATRPYRIRALDPATLRVPEATQTLPDGSVVVELSGDEAAAELLERLIRDGVRVVEFVPERGDLESAFLGMGQGDQS